MNTKKCRACSSEALSLIFDFGSQPLAGLYPRISNSSKKIKKYELDLTQCLACGLLQVTNIPAIDDIFNDDYRYSSSTVPDLVMHFSEFSRYIQNILIHGASILEFGCNDGVLLQQLQHLGFSCTGVDASDNVAEVARRKGLDVRTGFLTPEFVEVNDLVGKFDLVTCSNVFAREYSRNN